MKKSIEIVASFTGKISTGPFENAAPFYSLKEILQLEDGDQITDEEITARQKQLHGYCYGQFQAQEQSARIERVQREYQNIRFYEVAEGKKYPSVTSILNWDADFTIPADQLAQYASRGSIIHKQVEIFLSTGEWKEPKNIPDIYPDLVIVKQGSLNLQVDDVDFRGFYKEYPFKVISLEQTVINHDHKYAGRQDIKCVIESANKGKWDKVEGVVFDVPTILDVKSGTVDKTKFLKQLTAYAKCDGEVKQIGVIPLNNGTQQGFSKPIIEADTNKYWALFLKDRENFQKRYAV